MPGPEPQGRKHGRTPNTLTNGDWREYEDVPFADAPPMPKPPGRRKSWHVMAEKTWKIASAMPHCVDWREEDWLALETLMHETDLYYNTDDEKKKTAQINQIRLMKNALGMGEQGRKEQKIRYKQRVEPGLPGTGPEGAREVLDTIVEPPAGVIPMKDRRKAILGRNQPAAGDSDTQTA
jgi:hypothetical protein